MDRNDNIKRIDSLNFDTTDDIKLHKNRSSNNRRPHSNNGRPNLTDERMLEEPKSKPRLVSMSGLDLLSNPKKTCESSGSEQGIISDNDSFSSDSDDSRHKADDGVRHSYNSMFENSSMPSDDSNDRHHSNSYYDKPRDYDRESDASSISSRSSRKDDYDDDDDEDRRPRTYEEIQAEKQSLLFKLDRLEKSMKTKLTRRFTMASNIDDIKYEFQKLKRQRDVEQSIKFQRKALMFFSSGVEYLNGRFDPIDAKLDGWSESVMENISDYDEVFEELHDKYAEKIQVAPELKLLMMVGGSAFMFHLTQTLFKSNIPSLDEVLRNNPDIMANISQAAMNTMGQNMAGNDPMKDMMMGGLGMKNQQYQQRAQQAQRRPPGGHGDFPPPESEDEPQVKSFSVPPRRRNMQRRKQQGININI